MLSTSVNSQRRWTGLDMPTPPAGTGPCRRRPPASPTPVTGRQPNRPHTAPATAPEPSRRAPRRLLLLQVPAKSADRGSSATDRGMVVAEATILRSLYLPGGRPRGISRRPGDGSEEAGFLDRDPSARNRRVRAPTRNPTSATRHDSGPCRRRCLTHCDRRRSRYGLLADLELQAHRQRTDAATTWRESSKISRSRNGRAAAKWSLSRQSDH